ncbi:MAG TPA: ribose-phosphate diphosphokinase [Candidatus Woesebacteria bacterium]|nr:ribose-phosphate diphosphokinase [Candidatus Woesebacteria bacterium]
MKSKLKLEEINDLVLLTGTSNQKLAQKIGKILNKTRSKPMPVYCPVSHFGDGEIDIFIPENLRRRRVFIIQSTSPPAVNDYIMELAFMADAAKRASAAEVTAVIPYFGYGRQDRKDRARVFICSAVVANILVKAGVDRIVTIDIHANQEQGFVQQPWDNLFASYSLIPRLRREKIANLVVASPDAGGVKRAKHYEECLKAKGIVIVLKDRDINQHDHSEVLTMVGEVTGKNVLIVDDIISTAGSIAKARDLFRARGAKKIYAAATHGIFSEKALETINGFEKVFVTDTIDHREEVLKHPKIQVVSIAPLLAEAIKRIHTGESISRGLIR